MNAHYAPPGEFASDRSPVLVIPFTGSVYSMQENQSHVAYNMAPSTILTPKEWKHVSIHPDGGNRFKLCGYASATPWLPGDLRALGVKVKSGKVWGLTKDRALEIGQQIETAMIDAEAGKPLKSLPIEDGATPAKASPATPPRPAEAQKSGQQSLF